MVTGSVGWAVGPSVAVAVGDVAGGPQFTHTAGHQGWTAAVNCWHVMLCRTVTP